MCPRCKLDLAPIIYEGVQIETCHNCGGEWCDSGQLAHIVQTVEQTFTEEEMASVGEAPRAPGPARLKPEAAADCPKCYQQKMIPFNYANDSGVILDKCPACRGIWLDGGELEKVQIIVESWNKQTNAEAVRRKPARALPQGIDQQTAEARNWRKILYADLSSLVRRPA